MNNKRFDSKERKRIFDSLRQLVPNAKVLPLTASIMSRAAYLDGTAHWSSHYFDVLVASYASEHSAEVITTDSNIPKLGVRVSW